MQTPNATPQPPLHPGDRVLAGQDFGLVLKCRRDAYGWDVLVMPEHEGDPFWTGSTQLLLTRKDGER